MNKGKEVPVVLVGFSGSGKTQVGKWLHKQYGLRWLDVDTAVEQSVGKQISEIIRVEGESSFRALEAQEVSKALDSEYQVISVGGGALLDESSRNQMLERTLVVYLAASEKVLVKRVEADEMRARRQHQAANVRPLLQVSLDGKESPRQQLEKRVSELLAERQRLYELAPLKVWTDWLGAKDVAAIVAAELKLQQATSVQKVTILPVRFASGGSGTSGESAISEIVIGVGVREQLGRRLKARFPSVTKVVVIIDEHVSDIWGQNIWGQGIYSGLREVGLENDLIIVPSGEDSKNLRLVEDIAERMLSLGIGRNDVVVCVGGGVVGDLGGLIASLYMRGVGLVHLPTTVVAQVDSAIGGKTAVNLQGGKNLLGTFYPGTLVLSDVEFLSTLWERERRAGFAEVIKYGLIHSQVFFEWLEKNVEQILSGEASAIHKVIEFCSRTKLEFVMEDLHDLHGKRALLNFGHTIGHAVEKLTGFGEYLHGEAVAIGMVQALLLGEKHGNTLPGLAERTKQLLQRAGLPVRLPRQLLEGASAFRECIRSQGKTAVESYVACLASEGANMARVEETNVFFPDSARCFVQKWLLALKADKKRVSQQINFVILSELGQANTTKFSLASVVSFIAEIEPDV